MVSISSLAPRRSALKDINTQPTHFVLWGPQDKADAVRTACQVSYLHKSDEEKESIGRSPDLFVQEPRQEGKDPVFSRARGEKEKIDSV